MTANVLSLVAFIGIILVRVINLKDNIKKQDIQEAHVENDIEPTESGVEVPVNFVSKNTYKYVYTPAKYPKKKY